MISKASSISTRELWARLFSAPTLERFLTENSDTCEVPEFFAYITEMCKSRGEKPEKIIKRSNLENTFGHRLFTGARKPSRDTVLQLAFGFGLTTDETQQLLHVARASALHPKVKRDAVISYCIHNKKTLTETQLCLEKSNLPLIGGARND